MYYTHIIKYVNTLNWSCCPGLNRRPLPYHGSALPAELQQHKRTRGMRELLGNNFHVIVPGVSVCIKQSPRNIPYFIFFFNLIFLIS